MPSLGRALCNLGGMSTSNLPSRAGTYRILDLYCGAGGAAVGYQRAGFEVVGVDIEDQPRYPFQFIQADALSGEVFDYAMNFADAIHASPPCQRYSTLSKRFRTDRLHGFPDLLGATRELLKATGLPYVIENVPGAPLNNPTILCGSQFNLTAMWPGVGPPGTPREPVRVGLWRHRGFETSFALPDPGPHDHSYTAVPVYGYTNNRLFRGKGLNGESFSDLREQVMGIDWMEHEELNEAIPPAYTEHIGQALYRYLDSTSNQEAA